jgi:REP element-mobilizing transposase RayT
VTFYQRRLPHWQPEGKPLFLTWRLHGSLPAHRAFPPASLTSGKAFLAMDTLLDESGTGPLCLAQPAIAEMVECTFHYGADVLQHYSLHAYVIMANHVHLLIDPKVKASQITQSLKSFTGRRANEALGLRGQHFWQNESYDHWVRDRAEFQRIQRYIEHNPVKAGLVSEPGEYRWSSAWAGLEAGRSSGELPHAFTPAVRASGSGAGSCPRDR